MTAWRDPAIALSLANLCYLRVWTDLLTYTPADTFFMHTTPSSVDYLGALAGTLLLAGAMWAVVSFARREPSGRGLRLVKWLFLAALVLPVNALRQVLLHLLPGFHPYLRSPLLEEFGERGPLLAGALLGTVALLVALLKFDRLVRCASALLLICAPAAPLVLAQALYAAARPPAAFAESPLAPLLPVQHGNAPRILWIIFDEWDYRLTFPDRPPGLELPELDRFRNQTLAATQAQPPAQRTVESMLALLSGQPAAGVRPIGFDQLVLTPAGGNQTVNWTGQSTVFARARRLGLNSAVAGWVIPYCRLLNPTLTACAWWQFDGPGNIRATSLRASLVSRARSLFETGALSPFGQPEPVTRHIGAYRAILEAARQYVVRPDLHFILVHFPVPHPPYFFGRVRHDFSLRSSPVRGYLDSLALVDLTLGGLRQALERAGLWDQTAVLLTSDHALRAARALDGKTETRVPFLLKLPGQHEAAPYARPFNTRVTGDLLLAIAAAQLSTPAQVTAWLDQNSATP